VKQKIRAVAALLITLILGAVLVFALLRSRTYTPPTTKPATVEDLKKQLAANTAQKEQASKQADKPAPTTAPTSKPQPSPQPNATNKPQTPAPAETQHEQVSTIPNTGTSLAPLISIAMLSLCVYLGVKLSTQKPV
jgi:outer membrane biosynthesis protein TonB